jgi:hypothetical protein
MTLPRSNDPLPNDLIRFSEAFAEFARETSPQVAELEQRHERAYERFRIMRPPKSEWAKVRKRGRFNTMNKAGSAFQSAFDATWAAWIAALEAGRFEAIIYDPHHDKILSLDRRDWGKHGLGRPSNLVSDFVAPDDLFQPGPLAATSDGVARPVCFQRDAFEVALYGGLRARRSGTPGRPTSKHLIEAEFDRRISAGSVANKLPDESKYLEKWLTHTHPKEPRLSWKTIRNIIRTKFRLHEIKNSVHIKSILPV